MATLLNSTLLVCVPCCSFPTVRAYRMLSLPHTAFRERFAIAAKKLRLERSIPRRQIYLGKWRARRGINRDLPVEEGRSFPYQ